MRRSLFALVGTVILSLTLATCDLFESPPPRIVTVEFEIQLINANATAWAAGRSSGGAYGGFGAVNETIRHSVTANVGEDVFCKVVGQQWSRNEPGHQVLCRILVDDEEIYLCGDQGTQDEDTVAECGGPVYIPQKEDEP